MHFYDPLYGRIDIPLSFEPVVNSPWFRRLQHLRQLGLCYLSLPGGNHTRFEHSLGAFHLASFPAAVAGRSAALSTDERERLTSLLRLGTLCHDIGHGPFSHMTENVLTSLGARITHEEVSAAIVTHKLNNELADFDRHGISPDMIGRLITKTVAGDTLSHCAVELISSDLDLDRLDYLHRDAHYSGQNFSVFRPSVELADVWALNRFGERLYFELTDAGVFYAEHILFLRRNNYQRIVFDSRHMCVTAMFEKAVDIASQTDSEFGHRCHAILDARMDWTDSRSVADNFDAVWRLYGLADYEALSLLEEAYNGPTYQRLIQQIRRGHFYRSLARFAWHNLHYLAKQVLLELHTDAQAYHFRRRMERSLGKELNIDPTLIAAHVPRYRPPTLLKLGTTAGLLMEDRSPLGHFLWDDARKQYMLEVFVDDDVDTLSASRLRDLVCSIFTQGDVSRLKE